MTEEQATRPPTAAPSHAETGRVLLVDDSEIVLAHMCNTLEDHGYDVVAMDSPREALEHATNGDDVFDLFIVDVVMPDITGHELAHWLRHHPRTRNTPILMLTALSSDDDKVEGLKAGADDFLIKTVSEAEVVARVRSLISLGRLRHNIANQHQMLDRLLGDESQAPARTNGESPGHVVVVHQNGELRQRLGDTVERLGGTAQSFGDVTTASRSVGVRKIDMIAASYEAALESPTTVAHLVDDSTVAPAVVVIDDCPSPERRIAAFSNNIEEYISGDASPAEFEARFRSAIRRRERYLTLQHARDHAMLAAITDGLTGLSNRGYFQKMVTMEVARAQRYGQPLSLIMADLDHFKQLNDKHGHVTGDEALRAVARVVRKSIRNTDIAARYGGEEFAIILPQTTLEGAEAIAERVRTRLASTPIGSGRKAAIRITASFGVAALSTPIDSDEVLIERADMALYAAKRRGRNRVVGAGLSSDDGASRVSSDFIAVPDEQSSRDLSSWINWLLSEDVDSPLASLRMAAGMIVDRTQDNDDLLLPLECIERSIDDLSSTLQTMRTRLGYREANQADSSPPQEPPSAPDRGSRDDS